MNKYRFFPWLDKDISVHKISCEFSFVINDYSPRMHKYLLSLHSYHRICRNTELTIHYYLSMHRTPWEDIVKYSVRLCQISAWYQLCDPLVVLACITVLLTFQTVNVVLPLKPASVYYPNIYCSILSLRNHFWFQFHCYDCSHL